MRIGLKNKTFIVYYFACAIIFASCGGERKIAEVQISSIDWSIVRNTNIPVCGMWYSKNGIPLITSDRKYFKTDNQLFAKIKDIKNKLIGQKEFEVSNNIDTRISLIIKYKGFTEQDTLSYGRFVIKLNEKEYKFDYALLKPIIQYLPLSQQETIINAYEHF